MRHILAIAVLLLGLVGAADARPRKISGGWGTGSKGSSKKVRGYTTKKGTYVAPYRRTTGDRTQRNNYTTKGNRNPWTGKRGTKRARR